MAKLNPAGAALVYSTYLGGSDHDDGLGIAVDAAGNAYVTGYTSSTNFPTANAFQAVNGRRRRRLRDEAERRRLSAWSTPPTSAAAAVTTAGGIAVDALGNAYVTGHTVSANFPTVDRASSHVMRRLSTPS